VVLPHPPDVGVQPLQQRRRPQLLALQEAGDHILRVPRLLQEGGGVSSYKLAEVRRDS